MDFVNYTPISRRSEPSPRAISSPAEHRIVNPILVQFPGSVTSVRGENRGGEIRNADHVPRGDLSEICRGREEAGSQTQLDYRWSAMIARRKFLINVSPIFQGNKISHAMKMITKSMTG
jgi:hypothetical protein